MKAHTSRNLVSLGVALGIPLVMGGLGGIATASSVSTWYKKLDKPGWNPPDWVFGPVWTLLYLLMGAASWLVWRRSGRKEQGRGALNLYGVQLVLNLLWSVIFFGLRRLDWAAAEIGLLWAAILGTVQRFYAVEPAAGLMLIPYQVWTTFAAVLNRTVWRMNRRVR